jgi:hypothetical protein
MICIAWEQILALLDSVIPFGRTISPDELLKSLEKDADDVLRLIKAHSVQAGKQPIEVVGRAIDWYGDNDSHASLIFPRYPTLERASARLWQAQRLRDDSHHLAARWQRNIAVQLVALGPTRFQDDESVFQLDFREVDVLVRRGWPAMFVYDTVDRRRRMEELELALDPASGLGRAIPIAERLFRILATQASDARRINEFALAEHYESEAAYVRRRLNSRPRRTEATQ